MKKSSYSLKQAPMQWYMKFDLFIVGHDYIKIDADHYIGTSFSLCYMWMMC